MAEETQPGAGEAWRQTSWGASLGVRSWNGLAEDANLVPAPILDSTTACDINSDACWVAALPEEKSTLFSYFTRREQDTQQAVVEGMGEETSLHKDINTQMEETNPAQLPGGQKQTYLQIHPGKSINFKYGENHSANI